MASERFRSNVISQIMNDTGRMVTDHAGKSALFHQEFKRRLGTSVEIDVQFDLQAIVQGHDGLDLLCQPFNTDEIDGIILDLPNDKAGARMASIAYFLRRLGQQLEGTYIDYALTSIIIRQISRALIIHTSHLYQKRTILRLLMTSDPSLF